MPAMRKQHSCAMRMVQMYANRPRKAPVKKLAKLGRPRMVLLRDRSAEWGMEFSFGLPAAARQRLPPVERTADDRERKADR